MEDWLRLALDVALIGCVGTGLVQAARLIRHLSNLQQGREDMERFVREFNATVTRAETGIKELRYAARESGDDLEKLVDKAVMVRDELQFLVESADQIAERLSHTATYAVQTNEKEAEIIPLQEAKIEKKSPSAPPTSLSQEGNSELRQSAKPQTTTSNIQNPNARRPVSSNAVTNAASPSSAPSAAALSSLAAKIADARSASKVSPAAASRAEQELLQALQNLR